MENAIICSDRPVTLLGGGVLGAEDLALALPRAPLLVAADGGAGHALAEGMVPAAVIGDMDSLSVMDRSQIPKDRLFRVDEQETTDFDKALRNIEAPLVLAVGFLGGRMDHQLSALNVLVRHPQRPCILIGPQEIIFHAPPSLDLTLSHGDTVSLFPMRTVTGRSDGLAWPIDGLILAPDGRIGTSNRVDGDVRLQLDGPGMMAILPRRALDEVMRAFEASPIGPCDTWRAQEPARE